MTDAIASWVTSLGDFPLDPNSGSAWLWSGGGDRLLWASAAARVEMAADAETTPADAALVRSFAPLLALAEPDREPIRVHQLAPGRGPRPQVHTCLCRHVPLRDGGYGLLAVAIGAPARSMAEVRGEAAEPQLTPPSTSEFEPQPSLFDAPPAVSAASTDISMASTEEAGRVSDPSAPPDPDAGSVADPSETSSSETIAAAPPEAPEWTGLDRGDRTPIRFVWQTGPDGRFIHISRELASAVGPGRAMVLGRTWEELAALLDLEEWDGVAAGFRSRDTWTATPVLWPVENANLGVPVEMAGLRVLEAGQFDGFRGYGIARIERAVERPGTAARALEEDKVDENAGSEPPEALLGQASVRPQIRLRDLRRTGRSGEADAAPMVEPLADPVPPVVVEEQASIPPPLTPAPALEAKVLGFNRTLPEPPPRIVDAPSERDAGGLEPRIVADPQSASATAADSALSASEREAFREIAKALGAMTENLGRQAVTATQPTRDARPIEILRRDIVHLARPVQAPAAQGVDLRQIASNASRPSQTVSASILDALPTGLLIAQDGQAVFANRALLDLAGYPDLSALNAEGGPARLFGVREGGPAPGRFEVKTRPGESRPVEATVHPVEWTGTPAVLTTIRAVVELPAEARVRALEMELRSAEAELRELRSVLDTATDGVILLDAEGRILSLNRSAEALFGYDQNEIAGEKLTLLLEPDSHIAALDYLDGLKSNGVNSILNDGRDVRGRERNGGAIPLFMTIGRVGEREGGAKFCAVLRDVTHWKKVESDLLEAKRAAEDANAHKSDFLARISHEVRTPLNAIIGFSQVMMAESFGPIGNDRYRQYAKDIHASGEHVVSLVNDLLDLSKIAAGRLELSFGSVDVNAVVAGTVAMIQPQANGNRVIVRSQLAQQLPSVVADERSLRQIMLNLLSNAARYTEPGGQVVASTSLSERGEVVIRVSDTGIGMADEEVRRAMEPFRQIPGPRSGGGTGLGLPLTKALVEANRAAFNIRSEPRKGTMVEVVFPSTRVLAE